MLDHCGPDPGPSEQRHHADVRVSGALVQRQTLPIEETSEDEVGSDLGQC